MKFLVEAVFAVWNVSEIFDSVVAVVLVLVVYFVSRPDAMYDEPDESVGFVSFSVDADTSVSITV